jgi:hypothetical protein
VQITFKAKKVSGAGFGSIEELKTISRPSRIILVIESLVELDCFFMGKKLFSSLFFELEAYERKILLPAHNFFVFFSFQINNQKQVQQSSYNLPRSAPDNHSIRFETKERSGGST